MHALAGRRLSSTGKLRQHHSKASGQLTAPLLLLVLSFSLSVPPAPSTYSVQALEDQKCYGALAELPGIQARLLGKQMMALETLMSDLQTTLYVTDYGQLLPQCSSQTATQFVCLLNAGRSVEE